MEISKEVSTNERTSSKVEVKAKVKKMELIRILIAAVQNLLPGQMIGTGIGIPSYLW